MMSFWKKFIKTSQQKYLAITIQTLGSIVLLVIAWKIVETFPVRKAIAQEESVHTHFTPISEMPIGSAYVKATPSTFLINTSTAVQFSYQFPRSLHQQEPIIELQKLDEETGVVIGTEGFLYDDGQLSNGDDLGGDGVFHFQNTYSFDTETMILLRAKVTVDDKIYYSQPLKVLAYDSEVPTAAQLQIMRETLGNAEALYDELLPIKGVALAHEETVEYLNSLDIVAEAISEYGALPGQAPIYGISVSFTFGISAGISTNPPGTR